MPELTEVQVFRSSRSWLLILAKRRTDPDTLVMGRENVGVHGVSGV